MYDGNGTFARYQSVKAYPIVSTPTEAGHSRVARLPVGRGALDRVAISEPSLRRSRRELCPDDSLHVVGWAASSAPGGPFDTLSLYVDDTFALSVQYSVARADITAHGPDRSLRKTGFDLKFPVKDIMPGSHTLAIVGTVGTRQLRVSEIVDFTVVAVPIEAQSRSEQADRPSRLRVLHDTFPSKRDDGRSAAAVRPGASLKIEGWALAPDAVHSPEKLCVLIVGEAVMYRVEVRQTVEPEAGVAGGLLATDAGFTTCVDCTRLQPGIYEMWIETLFDESWTSMPAGRRIEVLPPLTSWLPAALATFRTPSAVTFDAPVPTRIEQGSDFLIRGNFACDGQVGAVFVRFDIEQSFELTISATDSESVVRFSGLLQPRLAKGAHAVEIIALDIAGRGTYLIESALLDVAAVDL